MSIRFATCNILFDDGKSQPLWPERANHLVEYIHESSPDVIATQEGRKAQLLDLAARLEDRYLLLDHHRDWDDVKMYPCLFIKKDCVSCLESYDRWLSETPEVAHSKSFDSRWPKLATIAKLKKDNKTFVAASFHFDNVTKTARPKQAQVLVEQTKKIAKQQAIVLLGDANDKPKSKTLEIFKSSDYQDPLGWADKPHTYHGYFKENHDCRIDYILHDKNFTVKSSFCDDRRSRYYSDHYMVFSDLDLEDSIS